MLLLTLLIAGSHAYYGGSGKKRACLDYSEGGEQASATLVAEAVECTGNKATFVGWHCNVKACAAAVRRLGGTLFKWGQDGSGKYTTTKKYRKSKAGWKTTAECWMEEIGITDCKPQDAQYDVFKVDGGPISQDAAVIKKKVECMSSDVNLSNKGGVLECAAAVKKEGGKYFIFSRPREGKDLQCWMENTSSASCPEGWETDSYDFWQVGGGTFEADNGYTCRGKCAGRRSCHEPSGQCRLNPNVPETSCRGACARSCCNMKTIRCEVDACGTSTEDEVGFMDAHTEARLGFMDAHNEARVGFMDAHNEARVGHNPPHTPPGYSESELSEPGSNMNVDRRYGGNTYHYNYHRGGHAEEAVGEDDLYAQREENCFPQGGRWTGTYCDYGSRPAPTEYKCADGFIARDTYGETFRVSLEECKKKFHPSKTNFVYYPGSRHCQAAHGKIRSRNSDWTYCFIPNAFALAMDTTPRSTGPSTVVSGFAALGLAFVLFGSYKFYCGKSA